MDIPGHDRADRSIDSDDEDGKNLPEQNTDGMRVKEDQPVKVRCLNSGGNNSTLDLDDPTEGAMQTRTA